MDDIAKLIETLGFPIAIVVALGFLLWKIVMYVINKLPVQIGKELNELREINIKLIDAINLLKTTISDHSSSLDTMIKFIEKKK